MTRAKHVRQFEHTRWEGTLGRHPIWAADLSTDKQVRIASELLDQLEIINGALAAAVNDLQPRQGKHESDTRTAYAKGTNAKEFHESNVWIATSEIRQTIELLTSESPSALIPIVEIQDISLAICRNLQGQHNQQHSVGVEHLNLGARSGPTDSASSLHAIQPRTSLLSSSFEFDLTNRLAKLYATLFDEALRAASDAG